MNFLEAEFPPSRVDLGALREKFILLEAPVQGVGLNVAQVLQGLGRAEAPEHFAAVGLDGGVARRFD
jgi:hypothetical protein